RSGIMQDIRVLTGLTTKPLPKELSHVGLIVDDQDAETHKVISAVVVYRGRGRRIVNSVNSPTRLPTSIEPRGWCVTMSYAIDSPNPVPSPAGFVVTNGWNNLSLTSGAMPVPLSRTRTSTASPRSRVITFSTGRKSGPALSRCRLVVA